MGKTAQPIRNTLKSGTKVRKEKPVKKVFWRVSKKRMTMLRRRLTNLLEEKASLEAKNRELMESNNKEKKLKSELQKESFSWQRLYHESICSLNTYKVKHADIIQNLSSCVKDLNAYYPHIVEITEIMCRSKTRLTNQITTLRSFEAENYIPRASFDGGQTSNDFSKKSEKRMKHKVGPMVKGVLIQKPTIRLERVMLHQPQDQGPASNDHSPTGESAHLPSIAEENDTIDGNLHLGQISIRHGLKRRLGSGDRWRKRKQEQLEKERQMERERENQRRSVLEESSDSDDNLGPVIRLQRVSGLLLSRDLLGVDHGRPSEGMGSTSRPSELQTHRLRPGDDPKEGCSWMNLNSRHSKIPEKEKSQSSTSSDSASDEEIDTLINVTQKKACSSLTDSLFKNESYSVRRKIRRSSSTTDTSRDASDSSKPQPDSTINIDNVVFHRASTRDSLGTNSSIASSASVQKQFEILDGRSGINRSQHEVGSVESQTTSEAAPVVPKDVPRSSENQRQSSFCNNCTPVSSPNPDDLFLGKRIRKPKIHKYPGEESDNNKASLSKVKKGKPVNVSKVSSSTLSTGRKSLGKSSTKNRSVSRASSTLSSDLSGRSSQGGSCISVQKKTVGKKSSTKKSLALRTSAALSSDESHRPSPDGPSGLSQKKTVVKKNSTKKSLVPRTSAALYSDESHRPSQDGPSGLSQKKTIVKKNSTKKSLAPRKSSVLSSDVSLCPSQVSGDADRRSGRRIKLPVSYKESSINIKMRRPK